MLPRTPSLPVAGAATSALQKGACLFNEGKYAEAHECFERVLKKDPRHPLALLHNGNALLKLKQPQRAIPCLLQAAKARPAAHEPHLALGTAHIANAQPADAAASFRTAASLRPQCAEAWSHLGHALGAARRFDEAEAVLRHALTLPTYRPETLNHLGLVATGRGRLDEAVEYFLESIRCRPKFFQAWSNLGNALRAQNQLDEALVAYRHSLAIEPNNAIVKFNIAIVLLLQGQLTKEAWLKYEYRWVTLNCSPHRGFMQPLWRGEEPLAGKSILLYAEQGFGDTIQFIRYAAVLAARGATVHVEVQKGVKTLLQGAAGTASVFAQGEPLPHFDLHCPLLSVPFALDTQLDSIPAEVPYFRAPRALAETWSQRLAPSGKFRVGLVWRGNPKHANDANRSVPFETFRPVLEVKGCEFVCLQLGLNETEAPAFAGQPNRSNPVAQVADFAETAAIIEQLDLVIAVDTSVAHLAGGLGKPVWLLLPFSPDWRWLLGRDDSPWYPGMRLFRQPAIGDWTSVVANITQNLVTELSTTHAVA